MHVREPRERWVWFLYLWAAGFGGIPLLMLPVVAMTAVGGSSGNGEPSSVTVDGPGWWPVFFLLLFPLIAGTVLFFAVRRQRRGGFRLEADGIRGAHDEEDGLVPWSRVERLEWRHAQPTSDVLINGRPLPNGPALFAVLGDGPAVRIMQRVAEREAQQAAIDARLSEARAAGLLPVPVTTRDERRAAWDAPAEPAMGDWWRDGHGLPDLDGLRHDSSDSADDSPDGVSAAWPPPPPSAVPDATGPGPAAPGPPDPPREEPYWPSG